jgi:hypothetical protein
MEWPVAVASSCGLGGSQNSDWINTTNFLLLPIGLATGILGISLQLVVEYVPNDLNRAAVVFQVSCITPWIELPWFDVDRWGRSTASANSQGFISCSLDPAANVFRGMGQAVKTDQV